MALLQISEPGQSTVPHQHRYSAGIDLGTTNSLISVLRNGEARTLPDEAGAHLLPSVVHMGADDIIVGQAAQIKQADDPLNTISSIKRLMGKKSLVFLDGTEVDFARDGLNEGFQFTNPNAKDACGCGESFTI